MRTRISNVQNATAVGLAIGVFAPGVVHAQAAAPSPQVTAIGEVVVTARRRAENVQNVPLSVQAFSPEALAKQGVVEIKDLRTAVPGLSIQPGTFRESTPAPTIRGFSGGGLQIDNDPSIPFIVNEVPITTPIGQNAAFFDIQNVQVLKGPQGTLQGRNTVGGAILITTRQPDFSGFGGHVTARVGNYNLREFEGVINVPVNDRLAFRGAFHRTERDGTWTNIRDDRDYSNRNNWSLRLSARARITDDLENVTVYDRTWSHEHGTPIVFQAKGFDFNDPSSWPQGGQVIPCQTAAALCGRHNLAIMLTPGLADLLAADAVHQKSLGWGTFDSYQTEAAGSPYHRAPFDQVLNWGVSNTTNWDLGVVQLNNIFAYRGLNYNFSSDIDGTSTGTSTLAAFRNAPFPLLANFYMVKLQQVSEEFQAQGTALENKANWVAGVFLSRYSGVDGSDTIQFGTRNFNPFETTARSLGIYGQVDVKLSDQLTLTGGYRYSWDQRSGVYHNIIGASPTDSTIGFFGDYGEDLRLPAITNPTAQCNFNRTATATHAAFAGVDPRSCEVHASTHGSAPSYNITLQYRPTPEVMVYAAHRQGYRAGFLSARATSYENMTNQNEIVRDLELGVKSDFRVADMPVRFNAATYYSWYSNIAVSVPKIDPATGLAINAAENSGAARLYGGEASLDVRPIEGLTLNATVGLNYGEFDSYPSQTINDPLGNPLIFYSNKDLKFAYPHETFTLGGTYTLPLSADVGEVTVGLNYFHASERPDFGAQVSGKHFSVLEPYGLLNLTLDWRNAFGKPVDVNIFATNLTDTHYLAGVFPFEDAAGFRSGFPGDPRMFGMSVTYHFGAEGK